jgi:putative aldouronate transport system permease protein
LLRKAPAKEYIKSRDIHYNFKEEMCLSTKKRSPLSFKLSTFDVLNYIFMFIFAIITIFPLYYVVIVSLATQQQIHRHIIYILPYSVSFQAYFIILKDSQIFSSFFISIFVTVTGTLVAMLVSTAAGYVLSKKNVPGGKIMFAIVLIPMFFGGGLIPYYLTIQSLGLINNLLVLILPGAVSTFYLILIKNFFEDIPQAIEESAKIDGANDIVVLYKIVIPMSTPIIATISLFYAVNLWNDYFSALLFIISNNLKPLQLVLREILLDYSSVTSSAMAATIAASQSPVYQLSLQMAVIVIATVPIFIVYPFVQKYFAKGIMLGAVKE